MEIGEILKMRQDANGLNKLMHTHVVTLDKDGGATVEIELTDEVLNPLGMAHGGTIFTLCDIAAGSAAASQGTVAVTLDSNIHYYRPGRAGHKLTAVAYERSTWSRCTTMRAYTSRTRCSPCSTLVQRSTI